MKPPKLTAKQKAFADTIINQPKISATQAIKQTYGKPNKPVTDGTARMMASENLAKPSIQIYLQSHIDKASNRVVELIDSKQESIALQASKDVLDRTQGKATQRTEVTSTSVNLNLSLSNIVDDDV